MDFELFYFIPWPQCQDLIEKDPDRKYWSFTDPDFASGAFVEKEWYDENY